MPLFDNISVAARSSPLSKAQVQEVLSEMRLFYPTLDFSVHWVKTLGDVDQISSLRDREKTDFFTKEIDEMLLQGSCQIGIHSAKDLPDPLPEGLVCVAITRGVDPSDVLVFRQGESLDSLPLGGKIGTSSVRREKMIQNLREDLVCVDIRGTIEERLKKLDEAHVDAVIIAKAALIRLSLTSRTFLPLNGEVAYLQGRLAVIARKGDKEMSELFSCIDAEQLT